MEWSASSGALTVSTLRKGLTRQAPGQEKLKKAEGSTERSRQKRLRGGWRGDSRRIGQPAAQPAGLRPATNVDGLAYRAVARTLVPHSERAIRARANEEFPVRLEAHVLNRVLVPFEVEEEHLLLDIEELDRRVARRDSENFAGAVKGSRV